MNIRLTHLFRNLPVENESLLLCLCRQSWGRIWYILHFGLNSRNFKLLLLYFRLMIKGWSAIDCCSLFWMISCRSNRHMSMHFHSLLTLLSTRLDLRSRVFISSFRIHSIVTWYDQSLLDFSFIDGLSWLRRFATYFFFIDKFDFRSFFKCCTSTWCNRILFRRLNGALE